MARFGLYPSREMLAPQRLAATTVLALDTPLDAAGAVHFGHSFWLPLPQGLATAAALRLVDSSLQLQFAARRFAVSTGRRDWFPEVKRLDADTLQISFAWPAEVVQIAPLRFDRLNSVELFRADGKAVAGDAAASGVTGLDLGQPWVGSPLVVKMGPQVSLLLGESERLFARPGNDLAFKANTPARAAAAVRPASTLRAAALADVSGGAGLGTADTLGAARIDAVQARLAASVPALTLSGRPTSPRLKLFAESAAGDTLLWQALLPGEQAVATLPALPLADEWAPALEQLRKLASSANVPPAPDDTPLRLRLDIESDAPCTATLGAPVLAVEVQTELLASAQRLAFSGDRVEPQPLPINVPAFTVGSSLRVSGRVAADNDSAADAGATPADGRRGALLDEGVIALQALDWAAPVSLAGVSLHWQPLSDQVSLRLRLLADSGAGPGTRVLAQAEATIDTAAPGALALRWPALDLQAQRAWVELGVSAGAGVWLFAAAGGPGWIEARNAAGVRQPLPSPLTAASIPARPEGDTSRAISVGLGGQTLADALPQGPFEVDVKSGLPTAPALVELMFTGAVRGSVSVESVRWLGRDGG